jgi:hypothetical protein
VEKFGGTSSTNDYSEPDAMPLSSAAMVTAAKKVQCGRVTEAGNRQLKKLWFVQNKAKEKKPSGQTRSGQTR